MYLVRLWILCAMCCTAGVIKGVVLEHATGNALSRTLVKLDPIPGTGGGGQVAPQRTGRAGQFSFSGVPDGLYMLTAMRSGFYAASNAQRRPQGFGQPIAVNRDTDLFVELRMRRMGALTGVVTDENGVGIANVNVLAYPARLPLRVAGRGISDDRGFFRVPGLDDGRYWVRNAGHTLEDGTGLMPTFGPQSIDTRDAVVHTVRYDGDTSYANVRPEPASVFSLSGKIACDEKEGTGVEVTLTSETMHLSKGASCGGSYGFEGLPPGEYEIRAEYLNGSGSVFLELNIGGNVVQQLTVTRAMPMRFDISGQARLTIMARRDDLSGPGPWKEVPARNGFLTGGFWVLRATGDPERYVKSMQAFILGRSRRRRTDQPPDGFAIGVRSEGGADVRIILSEGSGSISGIVSNSAKPSIGAPVFLWPLQSESFRALGGALQVFSDGNGQFRFTGLPAGDYKLVATFDAREASEELMEESKAVTFSVQERQQTAAALALWSVP